MTIKREIFSWILLWIFFTSPIMIAYSQSNVWVEAKSINGNFKAVCAQPDIEVFSAPNVIMIKVNQPTEVRLFSILGKKISSEHLERGLFQYHMESHGIYIVKTDMSSCKIAI